MILEEPFKDFFDISLETYEMALKHDCFYDKIIQDKNKLIIAYLPFSTSKNSIFCGRQKFEKIHINLKLKGYKNFYITRVLFHKIMTRDDYNKWSAKSKSWYQDMKLRKAIFDEIQKDLENNQYSLLKDSDLLEPNLEFFSKELPLVKFKFNKWKINCK